MKTLFTFLLISSSYLLTAQSGYEISKDPGYPGTKILTGTIDKKLVKNDTTFKWYAPNQQSYKPDTAIVHSFAKIKGAKMQLVIFGGTWCEDTQNILPKIFKLQEMGGVPEENITLFGVNTKKQTLGNITSALSITNVPTIIVFKDGKELGRVVEYGKTGKWDKELAEIINLN